VFQDRPRICIGTIAEGHRGIARQTAPVGTLDRRAAERPAKRLVVELQDGLQVEPRTEPWLEL